MSENTQAVLKAVTEYELAEVPRLVEAAKAVLWLADGNTITSDKGTDFHAKARESLRAALAAVVKPGKGGEESNVT